MDIVQYLRAKADEIETQLALLIPERRGPYQQLYEATRYTLLGGGKRVRPILALCVLEMCKGHSPNGLRPCCTLELIHTYSLVHDDLPCMDNDDYRRGKLTVHRKYSEGLAVLVGDFLLTYAFEVLANDLHLSAEKKLKLIDILSKASGGNGMIAGQAMDIAQEKGSMTLDQLELLHRNKTGALLKASILFGGILADLNAIQLDQLSRFGDHIGLTFQIIDDILDVTESQSKHGRLIPTDLINKKTTYVSLLGIDQARIQAQHHHKQALAALNGFPFNTQLLINLADYIVHRNN